MILKEVKGNDFPLDIALYSIPLIDAGITIKPIVSDSPHPSIKAVVEVNQCRMLEDCSLYLDATYICHASRPVIVVRVVERVNLLKVDEVTLI